MATRWEVLAIAGTETHRLGFSARRTKSALLDYGRDAYDSLIRNMLGDWEGTETYSAIGGWAFGPVTIRFGETETTCRTLGRSNPTTSKG